MESDVPVGLVSRRVIVIGSTCAGKTTLAARLAERLGTPCVDLDALHWEPNWTPAEREVFRERVRRAVETPAWVISGNYLSAQQDISWPLADAVIWLDLDLRVILPRVVTRSWRRSRSRELLWGTNYERFWPQLKLWDREESLIAWAVNRHRSQRRRYAALSRDPRWAHIHFVRLRSPDEVARWLDALSADARDEHIMA